MARGLFGAGLQGISGSINSQDGGWTFNKDGTIRRRVVPSNPQTSSQQLVRLAFLHLTSAWKSQTEEAREGWNTAAASGDWDVNDTVTGTLKKTTGKNLFIALNLNYMYAQNTLNTPNVEVPTAPAKLSPPALGVTSVAIDASAQTVAIAYSGTLGNWVLVVKMTPPVSAGNASMNSVKSKLRVIGNSFADASPLAAGTQYTAVNGVLTGKTGEKVFYIVEAIEGTTGQKSVVASGSTVIVA